MKTIMFKGRRLKVENRTTLQRHYNKTPTTVRNFISGTLTKKGARDAINAGEKIPKNLTLRIYHTPAVRGQQSATNMASGHIGAGKGKISDSRSLGKIAKTGRDALHEEAPIRDFTKVDYANWNQTVRKWLDGKIDKEVMQPPGEFLKTLVRTQLAIGERARRQGAKGYELLNVSHDLVVVAAFEGLTGIKLNPKSKLWPSYGNGLHLYHVKDRKANRIILQYKRKRYDVTKKFNELMKR